PVSPTTFTAYLQVIVLGLKGLQIEQHAQEVMAYCAQLQKDFGKFREDFELLGTHLGRAQNKFGDAEKRLDRFEGKLERAPDSVALRLAGAGYLVLLGLRSLVDVVRGHSHPARGHEHSARLRPRKAWRQGVISNLGNPKMAIFFTSLLPQFGPSFSALLGLGLAFAAMTLTWLTGYAIVVSKAGDFLRRTRIRRALDAVTGAVLAALGL